LIRRVGNITAPGRSLSKEIAMTTFREKAEAQTEQVIGQMLGDELLVREGQSRLRKADSEAEPSEDRAKDRAKERDEDRAKDRAKGADQGIVRDERGQEQPKDKARAQQVSRVDKGGDPPGKKA
jgi:hypothetical protein